MTPEDHARVLEEMAEWAVTIDPLWIGGQVRRQSELKAACEAGAHALRMQAWQPIETAPKDADVILLYLSGSGVQPGWWNDDDRVWVAVETQSLSGGLWDASPTHWMPLPDPPSGEPA